MSSIQGYRAGPARLIPNVWGVSRATGFVNFGQSWFNRMDNDSHQECDGRRRTVTPPNDVSICNGQLREAIYNDNPSGVL